MNKMLEAGQVKFPRQCHAFTRSFFSANSRTATAPKVEIESSLLKLLMPMCGVGTGNKILIHGL